jgi:hypothetical protein
MVNFNESKTMTLILFISAFLLLYGILELAESA